MLAGGDWNMNLMNFHPVGNVILPTDELIFFRGVQTTNQMVTLQLFGETPKENQRIIVN